MNRKTIIACIVALAVLALVVAAAVFFLYSGTGRTRASSIVSDGKTGLLAAVPSDAVMVVEFQDLKTACSFLSDSAGCFRYFAGCGEDGVIQSFLAKAAGAGLGSLKSAGAVLSLHYNGSLVPLLAVDAGRAGEAGREETEFVSSAQASGLSASLLDCSSVADSKAYLSRRNVILLSTSDVLPKSAERHIGKSVSVLDSDGFSRCVEKSGQGGTVIFVSCREIGKFFTSIADRSIYGYADFIRKFSGWTSFSVSDNSSGHILLDGIFCSRDGVEDFANVFRNYEPSRSEAASVLPSYTIFSGSMPMDDVSAFISANDAFADGSGQLGKIANVRKELQKATGISPVQWALTLKIKEVSAAYFRVGDSVEKVLLFRTGGKEAGQLFGDSGVSSGKAAAPKVRKYAYPGFAASVFGPFFSASDESFFTCVGDWVIAGSKAAVDEYAAGRALENTLSGYLSDASLQPASSGRDYFSAYLSVSEDARALASAFKPFYARSLEMMTDGFPYVPVIFSVTRDRDDEIRAVAEAFRVSVMKTKAPVFERDTTVVIPKGPFKVKNSGTGRMNLFDQQDNMYLCLKELDGKGIWGVPFSAPICGCAGTIDYFANGKLQILFASGSKLYLIDRLGRYVNPFPVDLGKDILIGPGIYDFNGNRKYNVMILHKDNTIEMYNLQGRKPAQWKTITSGETIKGLPEAVKVAGKTYWVVRTSIQTLIFGFYGGEPLTVFEGDRMIRSDSRIIPGDGSSVKVVCYDGKTHTVKLQ